MRISDELDLIVQQGQPSSPPSLVSASQNANDTLTTPKHKGIHYPDVSPYISILRYVLDQPSLPLRMGDSNLHCLVFAEIKRSIRRQFILEGFDCSNAYGRLSKSLLSACTQATRQAYVAIQRTKMAWGRRGGSFLLRPQDLSGCGVMQAIPQSKLPFL